MKYGTMRIKCLLLALLLLLSSTLVSCGSKYREYGFTGLYYRDAFFANAEELIVPDIVPFDEPKTYTLKKLEGTKNFDISGETVSFNYMQTYNYYSHTSELVHEYRENVPEGKEAICLRIYSNGNIQLLSFPWNYEQFNRQYMYEYEAILDFAKEYVRKLNPNINLDEFELFYYGDPENDSRFEFNWEKCVSGVTMEVVTVDVDIFGNLRQFEYKESDTPRIPEISEAQLIEIVEEKIRKTLNKEGYEVSYLKDTDFSSTVADMTPGKEENSTYAIIYFRPLKSHAFWFSVNTRIVLEDGQELFAAFDMILTFK
ncbi:MAG: hypothetical protein IKZ05_04830 [Clostridia bacterium]|nr:hypothetical protein [Clostridia bacterium]